MGCWPSKCMPCNHGNAITSLSLSNSQLLTCWQRLELTRNTNCSFRCLRKQLSGCTKSAFLSFRNVQYDTCWLPMPSLTRIQVKSVNYIDLSGRISIWCLFPPNWMLMKYRCLNTTFSFSNWWLRGGRRLPLSNEWLCDVFEHASQWRR